MELTLPTPSVVDWNGDGVTDLVVGNSEGFILFFRNIGSEAEPRFLPGERLRAGEHRGKTITLKLRVAPFETRTRQRTLAVGTDDDLSVYRVGRQLLRDALREDRENGRSSPVRLIGISVSVLEAGRQLGLFDHARTVRLNAALDAVRARFGDGALDRASARDVREGRKFGGGFMRRPR